MISAAAGGGPRKEQAWLTRRKNRLAAVPISTIFIGILPGAYIYDGSHFHFAGDGWEAGAPAAVGAGGSCWWCWCWAGGFSGETMSHCVFQILPYLVEVGAVGSVVWALVRLTSGGETLRPMSIRPPFRRCRDGCAGDVRRRGRNTGNGVVHDRPRNAGRLAGLLPVPSAEGGASGRGMAAAALCADPAVGGAAEGDGGLMLHV